MVLSSVIWGGLLLGLVGSARILGVFPSPCVSHQLVFRALTIELARRGHELVIITPNPHFLNNRPHDNVTEIDISNLYEILQTIRRAVTKKRGFIVGVETRVSFSEFCKKWDDMIANHFEHPDVKKLIADKNQRFDLIFLESASHIQLIYTEIFKAPTILISSYYMLSAMNEFLGTIVKHPITYPHPLREKYGATTMFEKLWELKLEYDFMILDSKLEKYANEVLHNKFGPNTPTIRELRNNVDILFVNLNVVFHDNRPVPPNIIYVGPLHLQPVKTLPSDLQSYLDNSTTGVIYVSLGTNVHPSNIDEALVDTFLDAFESLPYDVLWKFDTDYLKRVPKNLKVQKWFPQRDLLAHRNIRLFITQAGLQSVEEAIDAAVPMVSIPALGDQFYNAYKVKQLGIGIRLDPMTFDAKSLVEGIEMVLRNGSFKTNIRKVKLIIADQPQTPIEKAVWWTEYVLRHKGAKQLLCPSANTTWTEYLMIDIVLFIISIVFFLLLLIFLLLKHSWKAFMKIKKKMKMKLP